MNTFIFALLMLAPFAAVIATITYAVKLVRNGHAPKSAITRQLAAFAICGVIICGAAVGVSAAGNDSSAEADTAVATSEVADAADNGQSGFAEGMAYLAAAVGTSLSGLGGGIAVAAGAPAAIGATSEDPKAFGKALIFVALGEGIALYGLLVSILILSKV